MTDYEGDEQLQDAFEEGNGDATHEEVSYMPVTVINGPCSAVAKHARRHLQELASMRARLAQLEEEKKKMEEHTVRATYCSLHLLLHLLFHDSKSNLS